MLHELEVHHGILIWITLHGHELDEQGGINFLREPKSSDDLYEATSKLPENHYKVPVDSALNRDKADAQI